MQILMVGDIVGSPGRDVFKLAVGHLKSQHRADFVVVNAENAAGGRGVTPSLADELFAAGADVITLGDHTWDQKEIQSYLERQTRIVRPANYPPGCPGRGWTTVNSAFGPVTVVSLLGRVFMTAFDCPYRTMDALLERDIRPDGIVMVDIHAEATSEKTVMGRYLDGRVTCVAGTHTHVQTSDARVLPKGTAYITDLGMTGSRDSAIGRDLESITRRMITGMPEAFKVAKGDVVLEGAIIDVDHQSGRARAIEAVRIQTANLKQGNGDASG